MIETEKKTSERRLEPAQDTEMGQGSFEQSQQAGKGDSTSRQGPKNVDISKDRG